MMSTNGWVAHPFWWHYLYGQDEKFLRTRAYPLMRECAKFYEAFLTEAPDGKYDVWPTGGDGDLPLSPHLKQNKNCITDLAFIRYLLNACVAAGEILGADESKRPIWRHIAENLRDYPTTETPRGKIFAKFEEITVAADQGQPDARQNWRQFWNTCGHVIFPGDQIGLDSPARLKEIAWRTVESVPFALVDDLVMLHVARVRLGSDELDTYETHTRALRLPNGGLHDILPIIAARENLRLCFLGWPIVINESILQSYDGTLRVAPVSLGCDAHFAQLRAVGAFLVSAEIRTGGQVRYIAITSEAGRPCRLVRPWRGPVRLRQTPSLAKVDVGDTGDILLFQTTKGATYVVDRPHDPWEDQPITVVTATDPDPRCLAGTALE